MYCQVVYLRGCHPERIQRALLELSETLGETCEQTLREINKADWEHSHWQFQCIAVASWPLRVGELTLAEFLVFDFNAGAIAKFKEARRLGPGRLDGCGVVYMFYMPCQHRRFTSHTFLSRPDVYPPRRSRWRYLALAPAHSPLTQACLGILLHLHGTITRDNLEKYPLAEFADQLWFEHARFENTLQITDGEGSHLTREIRRWSRNEMKG